MLADVPTRLVSVVVDSADPARLARWWAAALGWRIGEEDDGETCVLPPAGEPGLELCFVPVPDPKTTQNRVHLDLRSEDDADQAALVRRLIAAGAARAEVGQPADAPFVVLTDPEGNEFCVLEPRPHRTGTGTLSAVIVQAQDPPALAGWWTEVAGWVPLPDSDRHLRAPDGKGPILGFVPVEHPHTVKNRLHLDVAPFADDDQDAEVERVVARGARLAEVGQSAETRFTVTWVVLTDPEGNEFCILSSRGEQPAEQR